MLELSCGQILQLGDRDGTNPGLKHASDDDDERDHHIMRRSGRRIRKADLIGASSTLLHTISIKGSSSFLDAGPVVTLLCLCRSFYSECCRPFVPGNFTALMANHAVIPFHHSRHPCSEACVYR
ncbi:hypothetical protein BHM03_00045764 [Ensete ventricosum]|nr:hypothetical protein BHM03_00045764 [Ensete ventricosum]